MNDKDPAIWQFITSLFTPEIKGALFAFSMAGLRILYENKEGKWFRKLIEAMICGGLTYSLAMFLGWLSLPPGLATGIGGFIGLLGADYTRDKAKQIFERKIANEDKNQN